jgi:hypothetical protein
MQALRSVVRWSSWTRDWCSRPATFLQMHSRTVHVQQPWSRHTSLHRVNVPIAPQQVKLILHSAQHGKHDTDTLPSKACCSAPGELAKQQMLVHVESHTGRRTGMLPLLVKYKPPHTAVHDCPSQQFLAFMACTASPHRPGVHMTWETSFFSIAHPSAQPPKPNPLVLLPCPEHSA